MFSCCLKMNVKHFLYDMIYEDGNRFISVTEMPIIRCKSQWQMYYTLIKPIL